MKLLHYAYLDQPTALLPLTALTHEEIERHLIAQLEALFAAPCPRGRMPGSTKTWAEARAEQAAELLADVQALRRVRFDSGNKIQPKRRRRWGKR